MSVQQQNSREVKQILGCCTDSMTEGDGEPFSIRHFVSASRQKGIGHHWPFPEKYLKLCLNKGLTNILPPLEASCVSREHSDREKFAIYSPKRKESNICTATCGLKRNLGENSTVKEAEKAWLEGMVSYISWQVNQLSLSNDNQLASPPNDRGSKAHNRQKNTGNNIRINRKRKGRTKKKSLAEIFAVAKHCVLDGFDRVYVVAGDSFRAHDQQGEGDVGAGNCNTDSKSGLAEDLSKKKNRSCEDNATGDYGQPSKRSCSGAVKCKYRNPESKHWKRNFSSCKASDVEKPGGYERKTQETYGPIQVMELQDHHAY